MDPSPEQLAHGQRRSVRKDRVEISSLSNSPSALINAVVAMMEVVLLLTVSLSPWAYGAVHPSFEFLLDAGIAVLLALWAARMLLERQITWKKSTVALCLAGLFLLGSWQRTPLPRHVLAWLSPETVKCYDQFLPRQPEMLPDDAAQPKANPRTGSTLSLYPGATKREATRLLAVFLLFAVVFNNLTSKQALIRLSWVCFVNGVLLSLFGLVQFFSAPHKTVYWIFPTRGLPFGPFINRNHFPDYVNMCIGLGIGLLLSQGKRGRFYPSSERDATPLQILHNPRALWICGGLGLMVTAVAFSLSRGGFLALVGAAVLCSILGRLHIGLSFRFGSILAVGGVAAALSVWFGTSLLTDRLSTITSGEAFESRVPLWLHSLPIVTDFPIWGTGYGTFGYIEPLYRPDVPSGDQLAWFDHAHNDYLEILVEGGVVGLSLVALAILVVYRLGYRSLIVHRGGRRAGLTLGTMFAFTALVLHSFGEFGAHIPAITLLATVLAAHLCDLGRSKLHETRSSNEAEAVPFSSAADRSEYRLRLGGIAAVLGATASLGFGLVLCGSGWKAYRIDRLENAAFRAGNSDVKQFHTRIACLAAAASLAPDNAELHYELGTAHKQLAALLFGGIFSDHSASLQQVMLALQEFLHARDACPLLSDAQLSIAAYTFRMKQGDAAEDYLRRAKLLTPGQAEAWYVIGLQENKLNLTQAAWETWRHCLELSDHYLPQILSQTSQLGTDQLLEKVLPDHPERLLAAALYLYPERGTVTKRRPFLEKALRLLDLNKGELGTQDLLVKARIYKALDQPDQAIQTYRELLNRNASQVRVRTELASYLYDVRRLDETAHEIMVILAQEPKNGTATSLLDRVRHDMLQEKTQQRERQRSNDKSQRR